MDKKSSAENRPVVDAELIGRWKLSEKQKKEIDAQGAGCLVWSTWVLFVISLVICFHAGSLYTWSVSAILLLGGLSGSTRLIAGRIAYLHLCDGDNGKLRVEILSRNAQYRCLGCEMRDEVNGRDNPALAVIVLSGWYGRKKAPTRIAGYRFHPSEMKLVRVCDPNYWLHNDDLWDEGSAPMSASIIFQTKVRVHQATVREPEPLRLKLEEIMTTSPDLVGYRFNMSDRDFKDLAFLFESAEKGIQKTKIAEELATVLVEAEEKIFSTSRFGRSKEAGQIREFIADELRRLLGEGHPINKLLAEKTAGRAKKGGAPKK